MKTTSTKGSATRLLPSRRLTSTPYNSARHDTAEPSVPASASTSCSRFDLNLLLRELGQALQDSIPLAIEPSTTPLPIFASIGHLSKALQEMLHFIARRLIEAEQIRVKSSRSTAEGILDGMRAASHLLFPLASWSIAQNSGRPFGMITMIKAGPAVPSAEVDRLMQAARNVGTSQDFEPGLQRLGRVLRKHRVNLAVRWVEGEGTMFQLFIPLAEPSK